MSGAIPPARRRSGSSDAGVALLEAAAGVERSALVGAEGFVERRRPQAEAPTPLRPEDSSAGPRLAEVASRDAVQRRSLMAADLLACVLAAVCVLWPLAGRIEAPALGAALLVVPLAKIMRLYDRDELMLRKSTLDELPALVQLAAIVLLAWWLFGALPTDTFGRPGAVVFGVALLAFLLAGRTLAREIAARHRSVERCLLIGDDESYLRLVEKLAASRRARARIVAHVPMNERRRRFQPGRWAAPHDALEAVASEHGVHRVIVVPGAADPTTLLNLISRAKALGANVSLLPGLFEVIGSSVEFDELDGLTMLGLRPFSLSRSSRWAKRALDLTAAGIGLFILGPLLAALAVAIKLESPGPVLFRQTRVGRDGRPFTMFKLRSMFEGADRQRRTVVEAAGAGDDGLFKLASDPRITRVGAFLRRHSLDELPQLINVLRGEMSIVGPRPLIVEEDRQIAGWHRRRLHLAPGITGPWQVLGDSGARVPLRDMVTLDYLYAANWTLWTDAKVLLRTAGHMLAGRGL